MSKKLFSIAIACAAIMAFAGVSLAADANVIINTGGATAQSEFWRQNGAEFLAQELSCDPVCRDEIPAQSSRGIIKGANCEFDNDGLSDDTITINYQGVNSSFGCTNAPGTQNSTGWIDETTCTGLAACLSGPSGIFLLNSCTGTTSKEMTVGCADIQCASLIQTTRGYPNGRKGSQSSESQVDQGVSAGYPPANYSPTADMELFSPVIVPFGFAVNDRVFKYRCDELQPVQANYYHPCVSGTCNGGVRAGQPCTRTNHCPNWGERVYDMSHFQCIPGAQRCIPDPASPTGFSCDSTGEDCTLNTQFELNPGRTTTGNPWLRIVGPVADPFGGAVVGGTCPVVGAADNLLTNVVNGAESSDCVSFWKCVGPEYTGTIGVPPEQRTCVGGTRVGLFCDTAQDCPGARTGTSCKRRPIDNLSRMMTLLLFGGKVKNWQDFGPWYPDLNVALCLRHGGSGTWGTLDTRVMRGDLALQQNTRAFGATDPTVETVAYNRLPVAWHYKSSTDLVEDCIEYYDGGVGVVDVDKALGSDFTSAVHHVPHEGVEPLRQKIYFGEYPFWGAASCFFDKDPAAGLTQAQKDLATALLNWTANQKERIEYPTSLFWATGAEMTLSAPNDFAYPSK